MATLRFVVVAAVPVALVNVSVPIVPLVAAKSVAVAAVELSDWIVEDERPMRLVNDAKRPDNCVVTLRLVVVAAVEVESPMVRNCAVEDAEKIPLVAVSEPTF